MHKVDIRKHIIDRVIARRGKYHLFDHLCAKKTALAVIDMQNTFLSPGAPVEVPRGREIVPSINKLCGPLRKMGVQIIWITHANTSKGISSDWPSFFDFFVADDVREKTLSGLAAGADGQKIWAALDVHAEDEKIFKNRYSALIGSSSNLEQLLKNREIDTLLIAGTKTNVCCESTGRDSMMLGFKTVMVSDCCAALTDEEHLNSLENFIQQFGDVMTSSEVLKALT